MLRNARLPSRPLPTLVECVALRLVVVWISRYSDTALGFAAPVAFCLFILAFIQGRGLLSRLLVTKPFQHMAKLSFAIYMVHAVVLILLMAGLRVLDHASGTSLFVTVPDPHPLPGTAAAMLRLLAPQTPSTTVAIAFFYFACVLIASYATYRFIEMPGRALLGARARRGAATPQLPPRSCQAHRPGSSQPDDRPPDGGVPSPNGTRQQTARFPLPYGNGIIMKFVALVATMTLATAGDSLAGSVSEVIADQAAPAPDASHANRLTADMESTLKKAGFSDLKIMPNSILVRAKDKTGRPVAMVLHPGSMTELVTLDPHSGSAAGGDGGPSPLTGQSTFTTVLPSARLATNLVGLKVRNPEGETICTIKDLAIDHDGISAYIVGVGGLLDGGRYVAVAPKAVEIGYDPAANAYSARMRATSDQLKAAPAFKYEGPFEAGRR